MKPYSASLINKILAFIYFIGFEIAVYYGLSLLLFKQIPTNPDERETIIVSNWNSFVYFLLLYAAIVISAMLFLSSALPRKYKPQVMQYFWLSWLGLAVMLVVVFN